MHSVTMSASGRIHAFLTPNTQNSDSEVNDARHDEAKSVDGKDVENIDADGQRKREHVVTAARPRFE